MKITDAKTFISWAIRNGIKSGKYTVPCFVNDPVKKPTPSKLAELQADHHYGPYGDDHFYITGYQAITDSDIKAIEIDLDLYRQKELEAHKKRWRL